MVTRLIAVLVLLLSLPACSTTVTTRVVAPEIPQRPELPTVSAAELQCLSEEAYQKVLRREQLRRNYAEELELILRSLRSE